MRHKHVRGLLLFVALFSFLPFFNQPAFCSSMSAVKMATGKADAEQKEKTIQIPERLDDQQINALLAGMDDEQVRRLLINELKRSPTSAPQSKKPKLSGFAKIIAGVGELSEVLRQRLSDIRSGVRAAPERLPESLAKLHGKGGPNSVLLTLAALLSLFVAGAAAEWLFRVYLRRVRTRIESMTPANWWAKVKDMAMRSSIDLIAIFVFIVANSIVFFVFYDEGEFAQFRRLIFVTYLAVVLLVRAIALLSSFLLAPDSPKLRLLPLTDETARYLHRWVWGISVVMGFGLLVSAMLELQRVSEANIILVNATAALVMVLLVIFLLWQNRLVVARIIFRQASEEVDCKTLLRVQLAEYWHLMAIPYLLAIWAVWVLYLLVDRADLVLPILALMLSIPLYILLDWIGQTALDTSLGLATNRKRQRTRGVNSMQRMKWKPHKQRIKRRERSWRTLNVLFPFCGAV
ncbi:MAG: hypothetical protein WCA08_11300 [Desulfoferrobacter sp.]